MGWEIGRYALRPRLLRRLVIGIPLQMATALARFDPPDFEWNLILLLLPNEPHGVAWVDHRRVLNGIFWVLRSGSPWSDLPERYGKRLRSATGSADEPKKGGWVRVFEALAERSSNSMLPVDVSIIRAHQQAAT